MTEVAKTTSYQGAKASDATAYDRIRTTDEDEELLERYWQESKNLAELILKKFFKSAVETSASYSLTLNVSPNFNNAFIPSMHHSLFSFFVESIISKWYLLINKEEAEQATTSTVQHIEDVLQKLYYKLPPQ